MQCIEEDCWREAHRYTCSHGRRPNDPELQRGESENAVSGDDGYYEKMDRAAHGPERDPCPARNLLRRS